MKTSEDMFVGSRFGKDGQIEVLTRLPRSPHHSSLMYSVICHKCKTDSEMYGDGIFTAYKDGLTAGKIPCGCSKNPRMSVNQWRIRVERKCLLTNYILIGFGEWAGQSTYLTLECPIDGTVWSTCTINNFMRDRSCPTCAIRNRAEGKKLTLGESTDLFMSTGKYKEGTVFSKVGTSGRTWQYTCPVCSDDKYVRAGLCSGIFTSDRTNFLGGKLTCRCSYAPRWDTAKREYQIKGIIDANNLDYTFVRWVSSEGYRTQGDKFVLSCPVYGEFEKSVANFIDRGALHPSGGDSDPERLAHIYVLKVEGRATNFTGYGISAKISERLRQHINKLKAYNFSFTEYETFETTWRNACIIEAQICQKFEVLSQEVSGFVKEATYAHRYQDVINFVQQCLENDRQHLINENLSVQ